MTKHVRISKGPNASPLQGDGSVLSRHRAERQLFIFLCTCVHIASLYIAPDWDTPAYNAIPSQDRKSAWTLQVRFLWTRDKDRTGGAAPLPSSHARKNTPERSPPVSVLLSKSVPMLDDDIPGKSGQSGGRCGDLPSVLMLKWMLLLPPLADEESPLSPRQDAAAAAAAKSVSENRRS
ncbi:hypothetical protein PAMP_021787 [Pampus punctatissimus]